MGEVPPRMFAPASIYLKETMNFRLKTFGATVIIAACTLALTPIQAAEEATKIAPASPDTKDSDDVAKLKAQLAKQQAQLEQLRAALEEQKKMIEAIMPQPNRPASLGQVASLSPMVPAAPAATSPVFLPLALQKGDTQAPSPLSLQIGDSFLTPLGFMDFTTVNRTTTSGSGIGTNFGSFPYNNVVGGKLSESRLSAQNSRVGFRFDSKYKGLNILGYLESDFLGNNPTNVAVTSNSDTMRLRVYFVQVKSEKFEVLAGQSWSMLTPGRVGISPIPGDLFYSQDIDVNYQVGLPWSRDPQIRFVYHPKKNWAMGVSLESSEQYVGGSGGGGTIVAPSALAGEFGQFNSGAATLATPNLHPDIVGKIAYDALAASDGHSRFHAEIAGVESTFKGWNPVTNIRYTKAGGGGSLNLNLELLPGFRIVTNNFVSSGGGRWLFGSGPDLVIQGNGDIGLIRAASSSHRFRVDSPQKHSFVRLLRWRLFRKIQHHRPYYRKAGRIRLRRKRRQPEPYYSGRNFRLQPNAMERCALWGRQHYGTVLLSLPRPLVCRRFAAEKRPSRPDLLQPALYPSRHRAEDQVSACVIKP